MKNNAGNTDCSIAAGEAKSPFSEKPPVMKLGNIDGKALEKKLADKVQRLLN